MTRRTRDVSLVVVTILVTTLFIRLGIWQLHRLAERRAFNALVIRRLGDPPVPVSGLPRDTGALHFRRAIVRGAYDYAHEITLVERTREGSPGVYIVTPVRTAATDTATLVNRGWIYSPDGVRADLSKWREGDSVSGVGYALPFHGSRTGTVRLPSHAIAFRWLDTTALKAVLPYPVYPVQVVLQGDTGGASGVPPRVPPPPLDEGPHESYAIQWFSFAVISVAGTVLFLMRSRREGEDEVDRALSNHVSDGDHL